MRRGARLALGAVRLAVAAAIILAVAYVLSWQILWGGMAGSEAPFHLHLIDWVSTTFPNLPWWYQWDGMGVSYREAYPLASHWLAVAASRVFSTNLEGGAQAVQFALMPATALGMYAFFDWRSGRPLTGIVAAIFFLISPLPWVEWTHFGLYASWVGMPLLMPALIALDVAFFAWLTGDHGWRFRVGALGFVALTAAMGTVSPHLLIAPLMVAPAYALAIPRESARRAWRWFLAIVPALWISVALLSAFWLVAELQYLSVVRSHWSGAGTNFDPGRLSPIDVSSLLSLQPIRDGNLGDLHSLSPAVLLPAVAGILLVRFEGRVRLFFGLGLASIVLWTFRDLYRPFFAIPGFAEFGAVAHRPLLLLLSVTAPALGALGLFELPRALSHWAARRWKWPDGLRLGAAVALPAVMISVLAGDLYAFSHRVNVAGHLAYGPSLAGAPDLADLWLHHRSIPLSRQLLDPGQWRAPAARCDLGCPAAHKELARLGSIFPSPPARAELNSNVAQLDMAFHFIAGGGITHSYNDQVIPSRELASWLEESMLTDPGVTTKSELASALGVDAVVLSKIDAARAAEYTRMGWRQVSSEPIAFVNQQPSGLAAQWEGGTAVLVVGGTQASVPALYNFVFKRATAGLLPFASAWLVRGTSPYVDDYSQADLSQYSGVIMLGYRYHDQRSAWSRLDGFVRGGGRLFVETGWQFVDPDWNAGTAPDPLPVPSLEWGVLDPTAAVTVDGTADQQFGRFVYQGGGWGASTAPMLRPGASELVRVGDRIVAARWQLGHGRVVWSGMNLLAHDASSGSADEDQFVASQLAWLFPPGVPQVAIEPRWNGDSEARLSLSPTDRRTLVLFKESLFPGWSARLDTPGGSRPVPLVGSEMDFMLAMVNSVPAGSTLVFTYSPTALEKVSWWLSLAFLVVLFTWMFRPEVIARGRTLMATAMNYAIRPLTGRAARWGRDD